MRAHTPVAWPAGSEHPLLNPGEVHLWRASLGQASPILRDSLSTAELLRAGRFHFAHDRERFIAGRSLLRTILASYLAVAPAELRFSLGAHGKPALAAPYSTLRFNLSHSGDLLLLAVTRAREVGVDLEFMRSDVAFESIAQQCFAPDEATHLRMLPEPQKARHFYDLWTRAEARLKASGVGLANGTRVIELDRWSLLALTPAEGYIAAVAVEGSEFQLTCWSWPT